MHESYTNKLESNGDSKHMTKHGCSCLLNLVNEMPYLIIVRIQAMLFLDKPLRDERRSGAGFGSPLGVEDGIEGPPLTVGVLDDLERARFHQHWKTYEP